MSEHEYALKNLAAAEFCCAFLQGDDRGVLLLLLLLFSGPGQLCARAVEVSALAPEEGALAAGAVELAAHLLLHADRLAVEVRRRPRAPARRVVEAHLQTSMCINRA